MMIHSPNTWEKSLLANLAASGELGLHTAEYIRRNKIQLNIVDNDATNLWWKMKMSAYGPRMQPAMYLSRHLADKHPHSPWLMASIVHETRHLEQGFWTAFSVYGELEAWQLGFRFYQELPGHRPLSQPVLDLLALPLTHDRAVLRRARDLINERENEGSSLGQQLWWILSRKKSHRLIYWIKLLPLNPLISH
jgi:hypothetical protein